MLIALLMIASLAPQAEAPAERILTNRIGARELELTEEEPSFTFAIFGDRTGGPAEGISVLAQAVEDVSLLHPDLVMTVGDLVEGYNQRAPWMIQMTTFRAIMDRLPCPWYPVAGNHDIYWRGEGRPPEEHEGDYETYFGPLWYALRHKDCWFLVLYTDEANPANGLRTFSDPESQRMSPEQTRWLEETLARTEDDEQVFVFLHHPRWIGGRYGDDWERIHKILAARGNVRAAFAGHIHHMRYDGKRDGIEYFTLATVGGHQNGHAPAAGFLHQYHLVNVRDSGVDITCYPVGAAMDPRQITAELSAEVSYLSQNFAPTFRDELAVAQDLAVDGRLEILLKNPSQRPLEVTAWIDFMGDREWAVDLVHGHFSLAPGESKSVALELVRQPGAARYFEVPRLQLVTDYLGESLRVSIPERSVPLPMFPMDWRPSALSGETVLTLDGEGDYLQVDAEYARLPDGAFTLEGWVRAAEYSSRQGFLNNTESSGYGFFLNRGKPAFFLHSAERYIAVEADTELMQPNRWHHVAAVHDGETLALFLDGRQLAQCPATGGRKPNSLPLLIGADVDRSGGGADFLRGQIGSVRLSSKARYPIGKSGRQQPSFEPLRHFSMDQDTRLLFNMDAALGPWVFEASERGSHALLIGDAALVPAL